jgi:hypothetical protein
MLKKRLRVKTVFLFLLIFSCKTAHFVPSGDPQPSYTPAWVGELPPEDAIWGVGTASHEKQSLAMRNAERYGRVSIAERLKAYMRAVFTDYSAEAEDEADIDNIKEEISIKITALPLKEAVTGTRWKSPDNKWWYRLEYKKTDAKQALSRIFDETTEKYPEFDATTAMRLLIPLLEKTDLPLQTGDPPL